MFLQICHCTRNDHADSLFVGAVVRLLQTSGSNPDLRFRRNCFSCSIQHFSRALVTKGAKKVVKKPNKQKLFSHLRVLTVTYAQGPATYRQIGEHIQLLFQALLVRLQPLPVRLRPSTSPPTLAPAPNPFATHVSVGQTF
jgi:hypothetical protein